MAVGERGGVMREGGDADIDADIGLSQQCPLLQPEHDDGFVIRMGCGTAICFSDGTPGEALLEGGKNGYLNSVEVGGLLYSCLSGGLGGREKLFDSK
jgi:hypothetical protein